MKSVKRVIAPVRVDFAGGTTDIYPFTYSHGGGVLNAAINKHIKGHLVAGTENVSLCYEGDIPTSSGLGTSGVMNLVWLALISKSKDKNELCEKVYKIEQAMGLVGGKQDQYAGAYGGINFMEFKRDKVIVNRLKLNPSFIKEFEKKLVLVYSGKEHYSGRSNKNSIDNLLKGKNTDNLIRLKNIAKYMKKALEKGELYKFAGLMNEETAERRMLHKMAVSPALNKVINRGFKAGAVAAKVCGSGGKGGSILFFTDYRKQLIKHFGKRVIPFKFDFEGIKYY